MEQFDPYFMWLGIPPAEQPANHYRLLGLALFESNPEMIVYAADRQMYQVHSFLGGAYGAIAQQILNHLVTARECLLDPYRKTEYDEQLRRLLGWQPERPMYGAPPAPTLTGQMPMPSAGMNPYMPSPAPMATAPAPAAAPPPTQAPPVVAPLPPLAQIPIYPAAARRPGRKALMQQKKASRETIIIASVSAAAIALLGLWFLVANLIDRDPVGWSGVTAPREAPAPSRRAVTADHAAIDARKAAAARKAAEDRKKAEAQRAAEERARNSQRALHRLPAPPPVIEDLPVPKFDSPQPQPDSNPPPVKSEGPKDEVDNAIGPPPKEPPPK
ncbi:MAG: hypothetical protein ABSG68_11195 [Thermoguttaceae bacterium]|jgi:hypothetical protein